MENNESFVFYESFLDAIELLPEEEQFKAYRLIAYYGTKGTLPEGEQTLANAIFAIAKPNIDAAKSNRENGKKGGRPSTKTNGFEQKKVAKNDIAIENESKSIEENVIEKVIVEEKTNGFENKNHWLEKCESNVNVNVNENENVNEKVNVNVNVNENENKTTTTRTKKKLSTGEVAVALEKIMQQHWKRSATDDDIQKAMEKVCLGELCDDSKMQMLSNAFEIAAQNGERACNWRYVDQIYRNWEKYGIVNEQDLLRHEIARKGVV